MPDSNYLNLYIKILIGDKIICKYVNIPKIYKFRQFITFIKNYVTFNTSYNFSIRKIEIIHAGQINDENGLLLEQSFDITNEETIIGDKFNNYSAFYVKVL